MPQYRTKPAIIEAVRWPGPDTATLGYGISHPAVQYMPSEDGRDTGSRYRVHGAQGWATINPGDWIITEPRGDGHYPCHHDVFSAKYELVDFQDPEWTPPAEGPKPGHEPEPRVDVGPMASSFLRSEALKLAVELHGQSASPTLVLETAAKFAAFAEGQEPQADERAKVLPARDLGRAR